MHFPNGIFKELCLGRELLEGCLRLQAATADRYICNILIEGKRKTSC